MSGDTKAVFKQNVKLKKYMDMEKIYEVVMNDKVIVKYHGDNPHGAVSFAEGYARALSDLGAMTSTAACQPIDGYKWWGEHNGKKFVLSVTHEGRIVTGEDF